MRYDFQHVESGFVKEVNLPMEAISAFTEEAEERGWKRLWAPANIVSVPGYFEALAESDAIADDPYLGDFADKRPKPTDFREFEGMDPFEGDPD